MKNKAKNALISVLGASFIAMSVPSAAYAENDQTYAINVNIRIEGISERIYYGDVSYTSGSENALASDILRFADEASDEFEISWTESDYGAYISAVNDDAEASFGGWDGWMFMVNGEIPSVGVSSCEISNGDEIVVYYADPYGVGIQYPEMSYDAATGILSFTSMDTSYDADWNPVVSEQPVAQMNVSLIGSSVSVLTKTDDNGNIDLSGDLLASGNALPVGEYRIIYWKESENGAPLVLRSSPELALEYYLLGDVTGDGVINAVDATHILTAYAQTSTGGEHGLDEVQQLAANINGDSEINAVDASCVLSYYAYTATGGKGSLGDFLAE